MKKTLKNTFIIIFAIFIGKNSSDVYAQKLTSTQIDGRELNTITTAVPFLMIAPDARAGALGDAGAATSPDPNSIHWNPAKLAFIDKELGFSVSYTPWLRALVNDINLSYLGGYKKIDKNQVIGLSLLYFSLGDIPFTDETGYEYMQYTPHEFAADAAYARKLSDQLSLGVALRFVYSNLTGGVVVGGANTKPGTSVAADISSYYHKNFDFANKKNELAFGLNFSNIGSKMNYTQSAEKDFIPINMRLGTSWKVDMDDYNTIALVGDVNKLLVPTPNYDTAGINTNSNPGLVSGIFGSFADAPGGTTEELNEFTYSVGLEYWYDKQFALRGGYFYEHATKGNRKYFALGAGLKYNVFGVDFAYLIPTEQRHPLENTLRFTLLFDFNAFKGKSSTLIDAETPADTPEKPKKRKKSKKEQEEIVE